MNLIKKQLWKYTKTISVFWIEFRSSFSWKILLIPFNIINVWIQLTLDNEHWQVMNVRCNNFIYTNISDETVMKMTCQVLIKILYNYLTKTWNGKKPIIYLYNIFISKKTGFQWLFLNCPLISNKIMINLRSTSSKHPEKSINFEVYIEVQMVLNRLIENTDRTNWLTRRHIRFPFSSWQPWVFRLRREPTFPVANRHLSFCVSSSI